MHVRYDCWDPATICLQPSNDPKLVEGAVGASEEARLQAAGCAGRVHSSAAYEYTPQEFSVNENGIHVAWSLPEMAVDPACGVEVRTERIELEPRTGVDVGAKEIRYPSPELRYDPTDRTFNVSGLSVNEYRQTLSIRVYANIMHKRSNGELVSLAAEYPELNQVFALQRLVVSACEIQSVTPAKVVHYTYAIGEKARTHTIEEPFIVFPLCKQYSRAYHSRYLTKWDGAGKEEEHNATLPLMLQDQDSKEYTFVTFDASDPNALAWDIYTSDRRRDRDRYQLTAEILFGPEAVFANGFDSAGQTVMWQLSTAYTPYYPDNEPPFLTADLSPRMLALGEKMEVFLAGSDFSDDTAKVEIKYQTDPARAKEFITWKSKDPDITREMRGKVRNFETTLTIAPTKRSHGGSWLLNVKLTDRRRERERGSEALVSAYALVIVVTVPAAEVRLKLVGTSSADGSTEHAYACVGYEPIWVGRFGLDAPEKCKERCIEKTACKYMVLKGALCELYERCTIRAEPGATVRTKDDQELLWAGFPARVHKFDELGNLTLRFAQRIVPTPEEIFSKWDFEYTKSVLYLRVLPGEDQDASRTLIQHYNITQWTDSKVVLSVVFKDPIWISAGADADRI